MTFQMDTVPDKATEKFYRTGVRPTNEVIRAFLQDTTMVVHGTHALNAYLPAWLDRDTKDWDVYSDKDAEELAGELERKLDKRYGGDYFSVEPAVHPGTFRVRAKVTGETVADITMTEKRIDLHRIRGINYVTLAQQEQRAKEILADPTQGFRHRKDRDTLQRIQVYRVEQRRKTAKRKRGRRNEDWGMPSLSGIRI